jgi:hypothetical protein
MMQAIPMIQTTIAAYEYKPVMTAIEHCGSSGLCCSCKNVIKSKLFNHNDNRDDEKHLWICRDLEREGYICEDYEQRWSPGHKPILSSERPPEEHHEICYDHSGMDDEYEDSD